MVDDLTERSFGRKARELKLSEDDQKLITALVRLQGNLCFNCRHNQDLMRTTLVPPTKKNVAAESGNMPGPSRNALHVLLSSTSFGTSCFTLREWCVIAIRNVLEDNSQNQEVVTQLDAQNPVQSAALDHAGVRVTMDKQGKVSLSTLDEKEEEKPDC
jgi:ataxin-10